MRDRFLRLVLALAPLTPTACSLVFPAGDLSSEDAPAGGTTGPGGRCTADAECDDGDPCTEDSCAASICLNVVAQGAPCGTGTNCTPAPTCSASGSCIPGTPDDAKCDDENVCTIDACGVSGCTHSPSTGAQCNDGNACDAAGTCNAEGDCSAKPVKSENACLNVACPGGYYTTAVYCDPFCGVDENGNCIFCINARTCAFACLPTFVACCEGADCSMACPTGYHAVGPPTKIGACGCGDAAPMESVTCSL